MALSKQYSLVAIAIVTLITIYSLRYSFSTGAIQRALSTPRPSSSTTKNVAVIIEDRPLAIISPFLLHFSSVLGPAWPIVYYTSTREGSNANSSAWQRALGDGLIEVRQIPKEAGSTSHASRSALLTSPWLWEQLAPAGHVLLFQADSMICSNSQANVADFLQYDFVGAPIEVPQNPSNDERGERVQWRILFAKSTDDVGHRQAVQLAGRERIRRVQQARLHYSEAMLEIRGPVVLPQDDEHVRSTIAYEQSR